MAPPFTSEYAYTVLEQACREVGEPAGGAGMLRLGENAIFRLGGESSCVVVRVARDRSRLAIAERELRVARWLATAGQVPAVRVHEEVEHQPRVVSGHPVTFWRYVSSQAPAPSVVDLAGILRALHDLGDAPPQWLPRFDPLATVRPRLERGVGLPDSDREFLWSRCAEIEAQLPALEYVLAPGPIHGDAHTANLLGTAGDAYLSDFETFATGPREWDLVPLAVAVARLGLPLEQWKEFVTAYGFDVRSWSGYPVLSEARELGMTSWLAQNVAESDAIAREVRLRLRCLRNGDRDHAWTAF